MAGGAQAEGARAADGGRQRRRVRGSTDLGGPRATFAFTELLGDPLIWRTHDHTPLQRIKTVKSTAGLFSGRHPVSSADSLMIKHCWLCLGCERSYNKMEWTAQLNLNCFYLFLKKKNITENNPSAYCVGVSDRRRRQFKDNHRSGGALEHLTWISRWRRQWNPRLESNASSS